MLNLCAHNLQLTSEWLWLSSGGKAQPRSSHGAQQQTLILDFISSISWPELWNMPGFMHSAFCVPVSLSLATPKGANPAAHSKWCEFLPTTTVMFLNQ